MSDLAGPAAAYSPAHAGAGVPQAASPAGDAPCFTPSDFVAVVNQTLEYAYASVLVTGEVASFKVNQGKWVFFDIKDEETSVPCFMSVWGLRQPLEDGMKVVVRGTPKLTKWGKFSLTVTKVAPVGEGSLKKAYEMLKRKLADEGLFDPARKRGIPERLTRLGVISSTQAAGYADFVKIINARWGGMKVSVAHTQVQGMDAPDQIIRALQYFNERGDVRMIALIRGGGSADDLSCFNDEKLVRAVAASKIPVICGIGHEVDESLCDLAADVRASTPSNAAEMLTPDKMAVRARLMTEMGGMALAVKNAINAMLGGLGAKSADWKRVICAKIDQNAALVQQKWKLIAALNPERVLERGYAIIAGDKSPGGVVKITTFTEEIEAKIVKIQERKVQDGGKEGN
ncbi:exodeoxyribonuclease VII large subunit [Candidatus Saccharibacteria bacterium]|nr:exodeoxyribonuclease VII large subunit [Candidatus Saccharibacteria bacterium]